MASGPRAYWKGRLRLSLVTVGVAMYAATSSASRLTLHQIHAPSGKRVRHQKIVPDIGPVSSEDIVKGYEYERGSYVMLDPDELEEIRVESRHTIDLVQFVEHCEIDPRYFNRPYYLLPDGEGAEEGFAVMRDALRESERVGLGQMTLQGAEHLVALKPCGQGLLLETLRFSDEIRDSEAIFDHMPDVDVDEDMKDLAKELIERKTAPFDASAFKDSYAEELRKLIDRKLKGKKVVHAEQGSERDSRGGNVIDLREALKKSVSRSKRATRGGGSKNAGRNKKSSKTSASSGKRSRKRKAS